MRPGLAVTVVGRGAVPCVLSVILCESLWFKWLVYV